MKAPVQQPDYYTAHESNALRLSKWGIACAFFLALAAALSSCAAMPDGPTAEQRAERMGPDGGPVHTVDTYTTADGFDAPVEKQQQP